MHCYVGILVVPDEFVPVTHYAPLDIMHNRAMHYEIVDCSRMKREVP